jgi:hypothetical protein
VCEADNRLDDVCDPLHPIQLLDTLRERRLAAADARQRTVLDVRVPDASPSRLGKPASATSSIAAVVLMSWPVMRPVNCSGGR